jgi:transposase
MISPNPGAGLLTATATVAAMHDANAFRSGREFAAWIGLVPGQTGRGGKVSLLGMSKRGDTHLRALLIHGARAVLQHAEAPSLRLQQPSRRRPPNVVIVALANQVACTICAVLAHERAYDKGRVSLRPHAAAD